MRPFLKLFEYQDEKGLKIIEHETLIKKIKIHLRIVIYINETNYNFITSIFNLYPILRFIGLITRQYIFPELYLNRKGPDCLFIELICKCYVC